MISQEEEKKKSKKTSRDPGQASKTETASARNVKQLKNQLRAKRKKDYPALRRMGAHLFEEEELSQPSMLHGGRDSRRERQGGARPYPMQLFGGGFDPREQLLDAIPRRNDTFYVLSFSTVSIIACYIDLSLNLQEK